MIYLFTYIINKEIFKKKFKNNLDIKSNILKFSKFFFNNYNIKKINITISFNNKLLHYILIKKKLFIFIKKNNLIGGKILKKDIDLLNIQFKLFNSSTHLSSIDDNIDDVDDDINIDKLIIDGTTELYNMMNKLYYILNKFISNIDNDTKKILIDIYNTNNINKIELSIDNFNFYKHFNYSLTVKENKPELNNILKELDKIRKIYLKFFYKITNDFLCNSEKMCFLNNPGTVGINSDYDITLKILDNSINYSYYIDIIEIYNKIFDDLLFINNAFDINLYTGEFKDIENNDDKNDNFCIIEKCKNLKYNKNDIPELINNQLRWSKERINDYLKKSNNENIKTILNILTIRDNTEINELKIIKDNFNKLIPFNDDDNRINYISEYNNKLKEILNERIEIIKNFTNDLSDEDKKRDICNLYNIASKIQYLSNDAYYSSGAYIHVVGLLQPYLNFMNINNIFTVLNNFDDKLLINFFIMSFNDNLGFLLEKEFHYDASKDKLLEPNDKELKYIYRCFNAITIICQLIKDKEKLYIIDINHQYIKDFLHEEEHIENINNIMKILIHYYINKTLKDSKILSDRTNDEYKLDIDYIDPNLDTYKIKLDKYKKELYKYEKELVLNIEYEINNNKIELEIKTNKIELDNYKKELDNYKKELLNRKEQKYKIELDKYHYFITNNGIFFIDKKDIDLIKINMNIIKEILCNIYIKLNESIMDDLINFINDNIKTPTKSTILRKRLIRSVESF